MRKIKFRAKTKKHDNWIYGSLVTTQNQGWFILPKSVDSRTITQSELEPVRGETIGQHLLITDIKGKDVYEGDIYRNYDNGLIGLLEIGDSPGGLYVNCQEWKDGKLWNNHAFAKHDTTNIEVIGNQTDNPEKINF